MYQVKKKKKKNNSQYDPSRRWRSSLNWKVDLECQASVKSETRESKKKHHRAATVPQSCRLSVLSPDFNLVASSLPVITCDQLQAQTHAVSVTGRRAIEQDERKDRAWRNNIKRTNERKSFKRRDAWEESATKCCKMTEISQGFKREITYSTLALSMPRLPYWTWFCVFLKNFIMLLYVAKQKMDTHRYNLKNEDLCSLFCQVEAHSLRATRAS